MSLGRPLGKRILCPGVGGSVDMKVVLSYNVSFRCSELFMYSIICSSQMLEAILFPSQQSEPFLLTGHHFLCVLLLHPNHTCLL